MFENPTENVWLIAKVELALNSKHLLAAVLANNSHAVQLLLFAGCPVDDAVLEACSSRPSLLETVAAWRAKASRVAETFQDQLLADNSSKKLVPFELSDLVQGPLLRIMRRTMEHDERVAAWTATVLQSTWPRPASKKKKKKKNGVDKQKEEDHALEKLMEEAAPGAMALAVGPRQALGDGLEELSVAQLELLASLHARQLARARELLRQAELARLVHLAVAQHQQDRKE